MSFAKYVIIENINNNFGKLFVNCTIDNIILSRILDNLISSKCIQFT